jgi:hypothetical protein
MGIGFEVPVTLRQQLNMSYKIHLAASEILADRWLRIVPVLGTAIIILRKGHESRVTEFCSSRCALGRALADNKVLTN